MKVFLEEYGSALYYALIGVLSIAVIFASLALLYNGMTFPAKDTVYNSDVYIKEDAPNITLKKKSITVDKGASGYANQTQIKNTLSDLNIVTLHNINDYTVNGSVNTDKEGTYTLDLVVNNEKGKVTKTLAIIVSKNNHLY